MPANISSPVNSFIQFRDIDSEVELETCSDVIPVCLPVNRNADIMFQVFRTFEEGEVAIPEQHFFGLINECSVDAEPIDIPAIGLVWSALAWNELIDEDTATAFSQNGSNDYDFGTVFSNRECFRIGIFENIYTYNWTFSETPVGTYAVTLEIDAVLTDIASLTPMTDASDVADLINIYFLANGITDVATSPVGTVVTIISNSGISYGALELLGGSVTSVEAITVVAHLRYCSNCLTYIEDPCYTSVIKYKGNEDSFGFIYDHPDFENIVRLPIYIDNPRPKTKKNVFRKSDGTYVKLSAVIEKEYEGHIDYITDDWHTKLNIALENDEVYIKGAAETAFQKVITDDSNYEIGWLNKPGTNINVAPGSFKVKVNPYYAVNSNCE